MAVFVLAPEDQDRLRETLHLAKADPIPLAFVKVMAGATTQDEAGVIRGDRMDYALEPFRVDLQFGWRVAISVEEQPPGLFIHVSMSSPTPMKTLPRMEAVKMVTDAMGCRSQPVRVWIEEFKDDGQVAGKAVNLLFPV